MCSDGLELPECVQGRPIDLQWALLSAKLAKDLGVTSHPSLYLMGGDAVERADP